MESRQQRIPSHPEAGKHRASGFQSQTTHTLPPWACTELQPARSPRFWALGLLMVHTLLSFPRSTPEPQSQGPSLLPAAWLARAAVTRGHRCVLSTADFTSLPSEGWEVPDPGDGRVGAKRLLGPGLSPGLVDGHLLPKGICNIFPPWVSASGPRAPGRGLRWPTLVPPS